MTTTALMRELHRVPPDMRVVDGVPVDVIVVVREWRESDE